MGLVTNDVALKASGSGSSSKIGGDKSEEDDDIRYGFRGAAKHVLG